MGHQAHRATTVPPSPAPAAWAACASVAAPSQLPGHHVAGMLPGHLPGLRGRLPVRRGRVHVVPALLPLVVLRPAHPGRHPQLGPRPGAPRRVQRPAVDRLGLRRGLLVLDLDRITEEHAGHPPHGTRYSRNGLRTVSPLASLMTRGRSAQAYMKPVTTSSAPVISSENQSRDWTTRSIRLATANTTQHHHEHERRVQPERGPAGRVRLPDRTSARQRPAVLTFVQLMRSRSGRGP